MIPPKEEAVELFNAMKGFRIEHFHSKKCARVAVKFLLNNGRPEFTDQKSCDEWTEHWYQTLLEIDKL